jgi:hypothetical protein
MVIIMNKLSLFTPVFLILIGLVAGYFLLNPRWVALGTAVIGFAIGYFLGMFVMTLNLLKQGLEYKDGKFVKSNL